MLVDRAKIKIEAGDGGNGSVSFHREKYIASGGPDGGDGGHGGNVIFVADDKLSTLLDFRYRTKYKAQNGENGSGAKCSGKNGIDAIIRVPSGTIIKNAKTDKIIADLVIDGQKFVAAKGGRGGHGNIHFATPTRQAPKFAKPGIKGQALDIQLELKLIADIGLLGFPNVGKSTLLSFVSEARPKVANYHFTTLEPNLGVVSIDRENSFVLADIPGIIEGASEGVGLGHEFLRHIERTRLLIHIIDVSGIEGRDPYSDFEIINKELINYSPNLADKKQIIAANKIDLGLNEEVRENFIKKMEGLGYSVFSISAATGYGVNELINFAYNELINIPKLPVTEITPDIDEKFDEPFVVYKDKDVYVVEGGYIEYLMNSINFDDHESLQYFQDKLRKKGIIDLLEKEGIQEGDTVRMMNLEFDFVF